MHKSGRYLKTNKCSIKQMQLQRTNKNHNQPNGEQIPSNLILTSLFQCTKRRETWCFFQQRELLDYGNPTSLNNLSLSSCWRMPLANQHSPAWASLAVNALRILYSPQSNVDKNLAAQCAPSRNSLSFLSSDILKSSQLKPFAGIQVTSLL